jgi:hypothetical protein
VGRCPPLSAIPAFAGMTTELRFGFGRSRLLIVKDCEWLAAAGIAASPVDLFPHSRA